MVSRTMRSTVARLRSALVVISPATTARSVVTSVSQATRLVGSAARQWSRMASLIWSATLSGGPIETDSLVKRYRSALTGRSSCRGWVGWGKCRALIALRIIRRTADWTQSQPGERRPGGAEAGVSAAAREGPLLVSNQLLILHVLM